MRKSSIDKQQVLKPAAQKLKFLTLCIIISIISLSVFLFRWQVVEYNDYLQLAESRFQRKELPALRGDILARDGSVLAYSEPRFNIFVYKNAEHGLVAAENAGKQTRQEFIEKVSEVLEMKPEDLTTKLDQNSQWIEIAENVTREQRDLVMSIPTDVNAKLYLDGLSFEDASVRIYPEQQLASHVIGFYGKDDNGDGQGRSGLEQYFDGLLKPQKGISSVETDSKQNVIAGSDNFIKDAKRGSAIKTTIDKNIQAKVEQKLADAVQKYKARSGTVIVVDPRTGEIIALANYPTYDPNFYYKANDPTARGDIAITNPYEIGSVGKIFTMSAAVDQGKVLPNTIVINGHKGCEEIIEQRVICTYDKKPQGPLTATDAMIKSDNLALFATSQLVGGDKLSEYLVKFGMGQSTGVQLSGEDSGFIKPRSQWNQADLATYSYGHSYSQTALQSIMGVAALANNGKRMEPMIVDQIINSDGTTRTYEPKVVAEVVTPKTTKIMGDIMYEVFKNNIPEKQYKSLSKYRIGMKSGTALIPYTSLTPRVEKVGYSEEVNTTYVGFDGSDKNTFVMLVNLSEPQTNPKLSFNNARYLWLDTFKDIKDDLGVPEVY
jgi:cell division protein FtsI/penicillin-binding protein 2